MKDYFKAYQLLSRDRYLNQVRVVGPTNEVLNSMKFFEPFHCQFFSLVTSMRNYFHGVILVLAIMIIN